MTTTTIRDLRANMKECFDSVNEDHNDMLVPRRDGKDGIVIKSLADCNSMAETEYLLSTDANRKIMAQAKNELKKGETVTFQP